MKNKVAVIGLAVALLAPSACLWASAGDSNLQGANGTTTGTTAPKGTKKHHGHHHKKAASPAPAAAAAPATK